MSKKSRKQRKKERSARAKATPSQARPVASDSSSAAPSARPSPNVAPPQPATTEEVRPEQVVGAVVEQVMHAIEDVLPEPAHAAPRESEHAQESEPAHDVAPSGTHATPAAENRRKHPRIAMTVEIDLSSESHFFSGLSGDVSEGGVFVETYRDIPVGSEVALEFELPNGTVSAHGAVKWHRDKSDSSPPGVGVEFADLSEDGKARITEFCAERAPLYYEVAS